MVSRNAECQNQGYDHFERRQYIFHIMAIRCDLKIFPEKNKITRVVEVRTVTQY